jgi:hypothetical protein
MYVRWFTGFFIQHTQLVPSQRHYREAEIYLLRFQQCMTRAMTLIRMNFVGSLRALSTEISKRTSETVRTDLGIF